MKEITLIVITGLLVINLYNVKEEKVYFAKKQSPIDVTSGPDWSLAQKLDDFSYPWREEIPSATIFQAVWDDHNFWFRFEVEDENILVYRDKDLKEEVVYSDRVEIFFKKDDKMTPYFCLEMDPLSRVLDYDAHFYRKVNFGWKWPDNGLSVKGTKTGTGYVVEGNISLASLKKLGMLNDGKLLAGLFRGECVALNGKNADLRWISWVDPQTERPDFHVPSAFGVIELVE